MSAGTVAGDADHGCPKVMTWGPCGGVHADGSCEVDARPCPFVERGAWDRPAPRHAATLAAIESPLLLVDVRAPQTWQGDVAELWRATGEALCGCTALLGEHVDNRALDDDSGAITPEAVAATLARGGTPSILTVTGRDRSAAEATNVIRSYRDAGASAIHCVTGDHPAAMGLQRDVHFGAEAMTLIAAASVLGCVVTVGESPASIGDRPQRLLAKQHAGASVCILNHGGDVADLVAFVDRCRSAGVTLAFVAPVPMVVDARSAGALARFPGLLLPAGYLDAIIAADDPFEQALQSVAEMTSALAASGRFVGVNLSGSAKDGDPWQRLRSTQTFVDRVRRAWAHAG